MSVENEFGTILWNTEGTSDKIWGYFYRPTDIPSEPTWWNSPTKASGWNVCVFWARRGKGMQFKADISGYDLNKLVESKLKKGYEEIGESKLMKIWPTFIEEAQEKLVWDVVSGKIT